MNLTVSLWPTVHWSSRYSTLCFEIHWTGFICYALCHSLWETARLFG